jgi:hypothetical protein
MLESMVSLTLFSVHIYWNVIKHKNLPVENIPLPVRF